ncbi:pilus assembly protein PilX [Pseudomonas syringae pv. syringae]|uniref:Type IV pilus protein n=4 Tax=Pseudomonas TaxID=286 RepID=Q4LBN4_PSESH|nr:MULTISPECIES: type 4 pilus major pilin [Pseudomonas]MCW6054573.1 pilus assembly protein PilX [Pseudomonas fragi]KPB66534.1 Type IV pilus protein [Pseudomonas savastanoi pv. phaseolicola]KPB72649.1 Type IV pilus protein [Pseudomonas amygdali pv. mellea]MBI6748319.1 pilus assembly protein PilX [Pseudomonas syringae]MBI6808036.1 pilus assembly protein PilX [Pseudomonas syringae]
MHNTTHSARANQTGYISVELLFALIVILIGMGYALYNGWSAMGSSDVNNEQGNVGQLIANTRKLKGSAGYGASGTDLIAQLSSIRGLPNMSFSGGKLYNAWSGQVTVVANGMTYTVTEAGLPQDACVTLATKIGRGQKVTTSINGGTAVSGEVSSATATSGCTTDSNTVAWTAY